MSINQSILNSTSFGQLQQVVETINNSNSVHCYEGTKIKVGEEIVDISRIKYKLLEIFDQLKSTKFNHDDYEKLASLLFQLQTVKESENTIKQVFRQTIVSDSRVKSIRTKCLSKLKKLESAPKSMKMEDCHTIAALHDLITKLHKAQNSESHHRKKVSLPIKQMQSRLYVLYKEELKSYPEKQSQIAVDTLFTIHQLNLIKPRSTSEITGIDVLEKKCIQLIREDKSLFNTFKQRYNTLAMENNQRVISKCLHGNVHSQQSVDPLELLYLEKIVGKKNHLQFYDPDRSVIEPAFDLEDPKDLKQCLELYCLTSTAFNYIINIPSDTDNPDLINLKNMKYKFGSLASSCAETLGIPLTPLHAWGSYQYPSLNIPSHQNQMKTTDIGLVEILEQVNQLIQDLNHHMQFDDTESSALYDHLQAILPSKSSDKASIQPPSLFEADFETLNEFGEDVLNQTLALLEPLKRFTIFCKEDMLTIDLEFLDLHLKGTAIEHADQFKNAVKKRVFDLIIERIHQEFSSLEKIFTYVKSNYDPIRELLAHNGDLRTQVYAKLDALIEEEMLQELDLTYTSGIQKLLNSKMSSHEAKKIKQELKKRIEGIFNEEEFSLFLGDREETNKYLVRLAYTAIELHKQCRWGRLYGKSTSGIQKETVMREGKERLRHYVQILWDAKDHNFKDNEHGNHNGTHFKHLFHEFYKFFFSKTIQQFIWDAIFEKCTTLSDFQLVLDLHRDTLREELNVDRLNARRTEFLRTFPIYKYLSLNPTLRGSDLIMPILLFIKHFETHKMSDLLLAHEMLIRANQLELKNLVDALEESEALTAEEIKTFRDNYDLPETPTFDGAHFG